MAQQRFSLSSTTGLMDNLDRPAIARTGALTATYNHLNDYCAAWVLVCDCASLLKSSRKALKPLQTLVYSLPLLAGFLMANHVLTDPGLQLVLV